MDRSLLHGAGLVLFLRVKLTLKRTLCIFRLEVPWVRRTTEVFVLGLTCSINRPGVKWPPRCVKRRAGVCRKIRCILAIPLGRYPLACRKKGMFDYS